MHLVGSAWCSQALTTLLLRLQVQGFPAQWLDGFSRDAIAFLADPSLEHGISFIVALCPPLWMLFWGDIVVRLVLKCACPRTPDETDSDGDEPPMLVPANEAKDGAVQHPHDFDCSTRPSGVNQAAPGGAGAPHKEGSEKSVRQRPTRRKG